MTMVGARSGAGPIMRYSSSAAPMVRKPVGARPCITCLLRKLPDHNPGRPGERRDDVWIRSCPLLRRSFPQLEALDLAGRGLRQHGHHLDPARIFPDPDLLLD